MSYSSAVITKLIETAENAGDNITAATNASFVNSGQIIVSDSETFKILATLSYDFQPDTARVCFEQAQLGPRSDEVFWWSLTSNDEADRTEPTRLITAWEALIKSKN